MVKVLKKYTTIPPQLYVNRDADKQLRRIVDEMQRPGYVLVARQMGKTNLLFNAKRTLENDHRLFAYVDLSNVFKYENDCYRNIIDIIVEPNENIFKEVVGEIEELRKRKLPPHQEYSRSLRILLSEFKGDIVVVLDEIDALRSADYSDNIFAQIRSNYFSRTNFPVFERLTYILSGVIEPADLIKDRNKSPFNIGDKIYLDDFSYEEHTFFIEKSCLSVNKEVSDEIYRWTNGNPRLTFDICSSVEEMILEKKPITTEVLAHIVTRKYLTTFDIAPIDHIRELVSTNKDVRNSIVKIHQGKQTDISDGIKKKLYLFGIIDSTFDTQIKIKNPIISKSLSLDWIKSIERSTQDQFTHGLELFRRSEFSDAIVTLSEYLVNSSPTEHGKDTCNYYIGYSNYKLRKFDEAAEYFSREYSHEPYINNAESLLGTCKIALGDVSGGKDILERVVSRKTNDFSFRNAALNLALKISEDEKSRALELYDEIIESTNTPDDDTDADELDRLRSLAYFNKGELHVQMKNNEKALFCLEKALEFADISDSLYIKYVIMQLSEDASLLEDIISSILSHNLTLKVEADYSISFSEDHLLRYLALSFDSDNSGQFEELLEYSSSIVPETRNGKYELALLSSSYSTKPKELLKYILERKTDVPDLISIQSYRSLLFHLLPISQTESEFLNVFNEYNQLLGLHVGINGDDIYLHALTVKNLAESNRESRAIELCHKLEGLLVSEEDEELVFESIIIYYWLSNLYLSLRNQDRAIIYADKTIQLVDNSKRKSTSMIDEEGVKSIVQRMVHIKSAASNRVPIVKPKKYGRNEKVRVRYSDGTILEGKYKKLESDIRDNKCKIIS